MLLIAAVWLLAGCGRSMLTQVERLMETDHEAADSLISSIEEPAGKCSRALYALLKTQIDYKMYRDATNDSTIRVATTYFGRRYKGYHAAMAWYSLGCVAAELGQDSTAADAYLSAILLFPDTMVRYYALAEQNLSHIYLDHKMDVEAIPMIKACRSNAVRLNDSAAIAFCDYNIANHYLYNNEYESAKGIFMELLDSRWLSTGTYNNLLLQLSKILFVEQDYKGTLEYADLFLTRNHAQLPEGSAYSIKADALYNLGYLDSAYLYYSKSLSDTYDPYTICDSYRRLSEIQSIKGNTDSATYFVKQANSWMDSIASVTDSGALFRIITRHSATYSPRNHSNTYYIILFLIVASISAIGFYYYSKKRKQSQTLSDFYSEINDFKKGTVYMEMVKVVHDQQELSAKSKSSFAEQFHKSLTGLREFIIRSSTQMSIMEIDYCIYMILGFKQKDFVLFYNISPSGSRNIKARIKDKVPETLFKDIFINGLHN